MDIIMAKSLTWYGGIIAAIVGLLWMIWQMSLKGEKLEKNPKEKMYQRKFIGISWVILIIIAFSLLIWIAFSPKGIGTRGALASALVGVIAPVLLATLESQILKKSQKDKAISFSTYASLTLGGLGISLLYIGTVAFFYGIKAQNLWLSFIIGNCMGTFILKIVSNQIPLHRMEILSHKIFSIFLVVNAVLISTILAGYHFGSTTIKAFFPILTLIAIFLSALVSLVPFTIKAGKKILSILPLHLAVFIALFISLCLLLIIKLQIQENSTSSSYLYPIIAGVISSGIFIFILNSSLSNIKGVDLSTGAMAIILLSGGMWLSFKWGLGLGISLYSIGLLSIVTVLLPYKSFETFVELKNKQDAQAPIKEVIGDPIMEKIKAIETKDSETTFICIFLKGITYAGLSTILLGLFKIFIQKSPLLKAGLDIAYSDNFLPLIFGIFISLCFAGFNLMGNNIFLPVEEGNCKNSIILFLGSIITLVMVSFSIGILFRLEGLGVFILGFSITALLGTFTFFAQKNDKGLYRTSLSPLWIATSAFSIFLIKYKDIPDQMTRANKQGILIGMLLLISVIYFLAFYMNKKLSSKKDTQ